MVQTKAQTTNPVAFEECPLLIQRTTLMEMINANRYATMEEKNRPRLPRPYPISEVSSPPITWNAKAKGAKSTTTITKAMPEADVAGEPKTVTRTIADIKMVNNKQLMPRSTMTYFIKP